MIEDYNKVTSAYEQEIENSICLGSATYEEVKKWYFSMDPVGEKKTIDHLRSIQFPDVEQERVNLALEFRKPYVLLIASQIFINHLSGSDNKIHGISSPELISRKNSAKFRNASNKLKSIQEETYISDLLTGFHMLNEAIELFNYNESMFDTPVPENLKPDLSILSQTAFKLLGKAKKICDHAISDNDKNNRDYSFLDLAVTTSMEISSTHFAMASSPLFAQNSKQESRKGFEELVDVIKKYFIENEDPAARSGSNKGPLHEALWMLDTSFLFFNSKTELKNAYLTPSPSRMDRPKINKPKKNRGIDMICLLPINGEPQKYGHHYIQLKSRDTKVGKYHNGIKLVTEESFAEEDLDALKKKIDLYEQWLSNDMGQEYSQALEEVILKSATDYVSYLENDLPTDPVEIIESRNEKAALEMSGFTSPVIKYLLDKISE